MVGGAGHFAGEGVVALAGQRVLALGVGGDLGHGPAGQHTGQGRLDQTVAGRGMGVADLTQQPVLALFALSRFQPDQQPLALHPLAVDDEVEVAILQIVGGLAFDRLPPTFVPQHDGAAAVFALGDDALEASIGQGVLLGAHGETLALRIGRGALGHRPALQHAIHFQAQVPVQAGGVVLLAQQPVPLAGPALAARHGSPVEVALAIVFGEQVISPGLLL